MIAKTFEIRDRGTFVPVLAVKLEPGCEADRYLLDRAGFGQTAKQQRQYVVLARIDGGRGLSTCDPFDWVRDGTRTYYVAHQHLIEHFDELGSGAVVDVQFLLGETFAPKASEAVAWPS